MNSSESDVKLICRSNRQVPSEISGADKIILRDNQKVPMKYARDSWK